MRRPSHSYADIRGKVNEDERHVKFTSLDLLSFVWQIASGMVRDRRSLDLMSNLIYQYL